MIEQLKAERFTCDCCGRIILVEEGDIPPGYHGTAYEVSESGGGLTVKWFACKAACLRAAVLAAVRRGYEES